MLLDIVTQGTTAYSCMIRIVDASDGTPETGVTHSTSGLDIWYRLPGGIHTANQVTSTLPTEDTVHTVGGILHISDGYYRVDFADAAFAASNDYVDIGGTIPDMIVIGGRIKLIPAVRGLAGTALPNAAAEAAGGLYTRGTGAGQINQTDDGSVDARLAANVVHGGGNQTQMLIDNSAGTGDAWLAHGGTGVANAGFRVTSESASGVGMSCTGQFAGANFIGLGANAEGIEIEGVGTDAALKLVAASGSPVDYNGIELLAAIWAHDAANRLMEGARQLRPFVVGAAPSASNIPTDITGAPYTTVDHFKGRVVTINEETKTIVGSSGSPVILTVSDFVSVPSQNDLGVIS